MWNTTDIGIGHCSQHTMAGAEPVDGDDSDDDELGGDDGSDQDMADDQDVADDDDEATWDSEDEDIDSGKETDDDFGYDDL